MHSSTPLCIKEPPNNSARARRRLCGIARCGFGERGLVIPNERVETRRETGDGFSPALHALRANRTGLLACPRKGPSRQGFASKAASRTRANPRSRMNSSLRETAILALGRCALTAVAPFLAWCGLPKARSARQRNDKRVMATVARVAAQATQACRFAAGKKARWSAVKRVHDLRLLRLKRAPRRVIRRLLDQTTAAQRYCPPPAATVDRSTPDQSPPSARPRKADDSWFPGTPAPGIRQ